MSDQLVAAYAVGGIIAYSVIAGFVSGVWTTINPPDRWNSGGEGIVMAGMGWPITVVCLLTQAAHHIGIAAVKLCNDFIRMPEKPK
jgi:hypothetical protein